MLNNKLKLLRNIVFYFFVFFIALIIIFFAINILIEPQIKKNLAVYSKISSNYGNRLKHFFNNFFTFKSGIIYSFELSNAQNNIFLLYINQFKWTFLLSFLIFIFSFILGNILGITSAYKINKSFDVLISIFISFLGALPLLIIALLALTNSSIFGYPSQFLNNKFTFVSILVPILISSFPTVAIFFSKSRKRTLEILKSDYYLFGKTIGLNKKQLLRKIVFKQLFISELNLFFLIYVLLFTVTILIERIFSIPGQSLLISFAFQKGELDIIMFYFTFNFVLLSILLIINKLLIQKLNPILIKKSFIKIKNKKRGLYE
ncbi:ABC transporter permease subunit [Metamycoplasma canadense]|uniref:Oligopeptide ABC transporter n=1 Tax=Metamycoplasma canadense TaxID=29554 RepID=A0A077L714_9BACT|nr:ABC transporter permease subunit [Metamycoplasma canadense]BAP39596.1 oligopeptide ABC transporter [Metamycoplasma canadense]